MEKEIIIEKLISVGGKRWTKADKDRIYFDDKVLMKVLNLECDYYNTGNVCSASLDGEGISNSLARKILGQLSCANAFYDINEGGFHWREWGRSDYTKAAVARLKALIEEE